MRELRLGFSLIRQDLVRAYQTYDAALRRRPIPVKLASAFVIFGAAELNAQLICSPPGEDGRPLSLSDRLSNLRWAEIAGFGLITFYNVPMMHSYYTATAAWKWSSPAIIIMTSVAIHPCNLTVGILLSSLNKGHSFDTAWETLRTKFLPAYRDVLLCWPLADTINILYVPDRYRVLYFNFGSLAWNTWLMMMMSRNDESGSGSPVKLRRHMTGIVAPVAVDVEEAK